MATWKWSQERPAEAPSRRPAAECSGATRCAPVGDTMPSPRRTAVGLHRTEKSGGLAMENDEEGCTSPTADVADFEVAARGENSMPKIPDATYEIEVLCAVKRSWEERQLQTTQLPHTPTR